MEAIKSYITGIQHIGIPTASVADTAAFYESLGFARQWENADGSVLFLQLGSCVIETYQYDAPAGIAGAIDHIALNVQDIERVFFLAKELGLPMLDEQINTLPFFKHGVRFFTVQGVNGEKVEFNQII
ncbi:MAG: VOC family protein [Eubacteriales bacterium]|nr:VOC family protein [Eubacteriales bacterium]